MAKKQGTNLDDLQKVLNDRLKQLNPMMEQIQGIVKKMPNMQAVGMKETSVGFHETSKEPCKATLTEGGCVVLQFNSKESATKYYNSLK